MKKLLTTSFTLTTASGNYHMRANSKNRTEIVNANGDTICTGVKCLFWLLRNKLHSVEVWSGNKFESAVSGIEKSL